MCFLELFKERKTGIKIVPKGRQEKQFKSSLEKYTDPLIDLNENILFQFSEF